MARYYDKTWCDSMRISFDYNGMMQSFVGENGIADNVFENMQTDIQRACASMTEKRSSMKWRELPYTEAEIISDIKSTALHIQQNFDAFVVLGIGGSALGPIAVHSALSHPYYNEFAGRRTPRFYVVDNVDPERLAMLFDVIRPERTMFNVITKSGSTSETMSQLLIITDILREKLGDSFGSNIIATTDREKGNLIKISKRFGIKTFHIPDGVGGRFSELSPVGLLAAAVCGIDIEEMLAGAAYMDKTVSNDDIMKNPAYMLGFLQVEAMKKGCNIHVMMPYSDRLRYFSDWYAQLWAESLGKRVDNDGNIVRCGQTPVKALGVTDQHSQIQLYTEGAFDKVITFIGVKRFGCETAIPHAYDDIPDVAFLSGHTQNELINAELFATEYAVTKSGHMNNRITLPEVNAFTIGELLYMLEVQTAFAGELLNINAFDQPGVEEGKNATYALLNKSGYDEKRKELENAGRKSPKFIIN